MNMEKFVYHGSHKEFDSPEARPKRNVRTQPSETGEMKVVFDQESFHATPHKWIALAYTCHRAPYKIDGKIAHYGMGVDLYGNDQTVVILGFGSLEESLQKMYGDGGYVYHFGTDKFLYKEGLGDREVIAEEVVSPVTVERVENPVEEMKNLGVSFMFVNLGLPENEDQRDYAD